MFKLSLLLPLLFIVNTCFSENDKNWPSELRRCKAGDEDCLLDAINKYLVLAKDGIPALNLKSIDPMYRETSFISTSSSVNINVTFTKYNTLGLSTANCYKILGFEKDPKTSKFRLYCKTPLLTVSGHYKINGQVLILPINGEGFFKFEYENTSFGVQFKTHVETRDGEEYLSLDQVNYRYNVTRSKYYFENLFNNKELSDNMNVFFNENEKVVSAEIQGDVSREFGAVLRDLIAPIFEKIPYKRFFIDSD